MSLKKNIVVNYVSQFYSSSVGILTLPLYLRYMGAEIYGLVGFYAMLQAWFQMLDMGMWPTMSRQTARYLGGAIDGESLRQLFKALEWIFIAIGVVGAIALVLSSEFIATKWLNFHQLPVSVVREAIMLMAVIIALRWTCGVYRSAIIGFEQQVWLGGLNVVVATLRFIGVIPVMMYVGATPREFFSYQLGVAVLELALLSSKLYRLMPTASLQSAKGWKFRSLQPVLRFSLSIAFTNLVWVLITQTDKLVLSKLLSLSDYGYFTLAVLVASGVNLISGPISTALMPRMARIQAAGDEAALIQLYRDATQLVVIIGVSCSLLLGVFARPVLWAWTGNAEFADQASPVLALYAIGNGILTIAAFQHYLQFAKGDMKLHVVGNLLFVSVLLPLLLFATSRYGMEGAGWVWLISNALVLLCWAPVVHRQFAPGLHWTWLMHDVAFPVLTATAVAMALRYAIVFPQGRIPVAGLLCGIGGLLVGTAALGSSWARQQLSSYWSRH